MRRPDQRRRHDVRRHVDQQVDQDLLREASGLRLKNSEPASDTATIASAAPEKHWAQAKRFSPGLQTPRDGMRRRSVS